MIGYLGQGQKTGTGTNDLYLKRLETERKTLRSTWRLKGLPKMSAERERIAEIDRLLEQHRTKARTPDHPE